jgi:hypothetical protein
MPTRRRNRPCSEESEWACRLPVGLRDETRWPRGSGLLRPAFESCLNWRWLSLVAMRRHPSSCNSRKISPTFTEPAYQGRWADDLRLCGITPRWRRAKRVRSTRRFDAGHAPTIGAAHSMIRSARCNSAGDTVRLRACGLHVDHAPMGLRSGRSSSRSSRGRRVIARGDRGAAPSPRGARSRGSRLGRSSPPARAGAWLR